MVKNVPFVFVCWDCVFCISHTNISTQGLQILTFPSVLPLSELGFDNYIEQSHCQPFLKTPSASNWCQFAAEVWDEAENAAAARIT